jgi:hypothetical protein
MFLLIINQLFYFTDLTAFWQPVPCFLPAFRMPLGYHRIWPTEEGQLINQARYILVFEQRP